MVHVLAAQFVFVMIEVSLKNQVFRRSSSAVMTSFVIDEFLTFLKLATLRQLENHIHHIRERQNRQIGSERFRTLRAGRGRLWLTQIKASHGGSSVNDSTFGLSMMGSKDDPVISTVVNQSLWQVLAVKTTLYGNDCYGSQLNAIVNEMETLLEQLFNLMEASCVISKNGFEDDEGKKTFQT